MAVAWSPSGEGLVLRPVGLVPRPVGLVPWQGTGPMAGAWSPSVAGLVPRPVGLVPWQGPGPLQARDWSRDPWDWYQGRGLVPFSRGTGPETRGTGPMAGAWSPSGEGLVPRPVGLVPWQGTGPMAGAWSPSVEGLVPRPVGRVPRPVGLVPWQGTGPLTEPSLSTALPGKQGVQGAYALVRGGLSTANLIEPTRTTNITAIARCGEVCHRSSGWFDCTEPPC